MKRKRFTFFTLVFFLLLHNVTMVSAFEVKSQYADITYGNDELLQTFNNSLFISRFKYLMNEKRPMTLDEEVAGKIDLITLKVEQILEMFPPNLRYSITLCEDMNQVKTMLVSLHKREWKRPGFYSPVNDTVYLSAKHAKITVVAHEVGHVVVEKYFKVRPPVKIHEMLAQFVEKNITD